MGLLKAVQQSPTPIPVVMITGTSTVESAREAVRLGAYDYIVKPFSMDDLVQSTRRAIEKKLLDDTRRQVEAQSRSRQLELEEEVRERVRELQMTRAATIFGLVKLTEFRDYETGNHLDRIQEYARLLARALGQRAELCDYLTPTYREDLVESSVLHDIGKTAIPDAILLKPGKLTVQEFETMKTHAPIGGDALTAMESKTGGRSFLTLGKQVAYYHHERWDGAGYPKGLAGEDIPLSARIVAVADVYDAVTVKRIYRRTEMSHSEAAGMIRDGSGKQFDPVVVGTFDDVEADIEPVRQIAG